MILFWQIFWTFFKISFLSFGGIFGVLPELERMIVTEQGWITHERFYQSYVMAQFLPGPNMAMCPLIGYWVNGWLGFTAGFLGIYLPPLAIMLFAFLVYHRIRELEPVRKVERAIRPTVIGLIIASCIRFWWVQTSDGNYFRILGLLFLLGGAWIYLQKKFNALGLIFGAGFLWLLLSQMSVWAKL